MKKEKKKKGCACQYEPGKHACPNCSEETSNGTGIQIKRNCLRCGREWIEKNLSTPSVGFVEEKVREFDEKFRTLPLIQNGKYQSGLEPISCGVTGNINTIIDFLRTALTEAYERGVRAIEHPSVQGLKDLIATSEKEIIEKARQDARREVIASVEKWADENAKDSMGYGNFKVSLPDLLSYLTSIKENK